MARQDIDNEQGEVVIYQTDDGDTKIDVRFVDETVWLTQQQMAELFQSSRTNIVEHIQHIYEEGELDEELTCRKFRQVRMEGNRQVAREMPHYNLDMITVCTLPFYCAGSSLICCRNFSEALENI